MYVILTDIIIRICGESYHLNFFIKIFTIQVTPSYPFKFTYKKRSFYQRIKSAMGGYNLIETSWFLHRLIQIHNTYNFVILKKTVISIWISTVLNCFDWIYFRFVLINWIIWITFQFVVNIHEYIFSEHEYWIFYTYRRLINKKLKRILIIMFSCFQTCIYCRR